MWANEDMDAVADVVRKQSDSVVDLQAVFGHPTIPAFLLEDGLLPSLEGQKTIVRAVVKEISQLTV